MTFLYDALVCSTARRLNTSIVSSLPIKINYVNAANTGRYGTGMKTLIAIKSFIRRVNVCVIEMLIILKELYSE